MAADAAVSGVAADHAAAAPPTAEGDAGAHARLLRFFARFVSAGYVLYLALLSPLIVHQANLAPRWWTPVMVIVVWSPAIALGLVSWRRDTSWLKRLATATALGFLAGPISCLVLLSVGDQLRIVGGPWIISFPGVAGLAAALVWRPSLVFVHLTVATSLSEIVGFITRDRHDIDTLVIQTVSSIAYSSLFVFAIAMAVRTGHVLDRAIIAARDRASAAAAAEARDIERERFDALIHDGVMSALLDVANTGTTPSLVRQARATLAQIDRAGRPAPADSFGIDETFALLRAAAIEVDERAQVTAQRDAGAESLRVPAEVARAVAAGVGEAMRNSVRHGSSGSRAARRHARLVASASGIRVEVVDDGKGFHPHSVPPHRLGLAVSIHGRMSQLPGGSAAVDSAPGSGTSVVLTWARPT